MNINRRLDSYNLDTKRDVLNMAQVHKKISDSHVKEMIIRCLAKEIKNPKKLSLFNYCNWI